MDLLVNGVSNPQAIDGGKPRFTWMFRDDRRGAMQTAYEILVASRPERLVAGKADYWDSGKVTSDKSTSVGYGGRPLPAATRFWWKVRIWDETGKASLYSAPAFFDMGLNQKGWTAHYIWDGADKANHFVYFRKRFVISNKPVLAKVYVTAINDYLLYCNGQLLGQGPARCDPYHYGQYNAYDVTKLLKPGTNVFAAVGHKAIPWSGNPNLKPAFLLEARFLYPDGSSSTIGTDESWKMLSPTAFIEADPTYFGSGRGNRAAIRFDSRREPVGWKNVGFDDSDWASPMVVNRSDYHLFAQKAPTERVQAALRPVSVTRTNGAWLVDFGQCINGWPKLTMRVNHPGDTVRVEYFQMIGERKPSGWDEYICHGGKETWDANFGRYTSFQTFRITGYAGKLSASDVSGMWAYGDADVTGRFRCSSDLLNDIYKMCERSARQSVQQGIISVDAQREQLPWLADAWSIANVLLYNHRNTTMIDKVVRDFAGEQMTNGYIRNVSPGHGFEGADGHGRIPEWAMYWPMLLWQQYLFSGDETLLREMAPRVALFLEWLKPFQDPETKLLNPLKMWRISDFAGGDMPGGGYNIATACQYYENLRIASRVFSVLGETNRSEDYLRQAESVKEGINTHLFNGRYYLARTDTSKMFPLASAWPLRFDIERAADKSKILAAVEKSGKPNIGGYGGDAFYSGMLNAGEGAYVVHDLARYRPMLDSNRTCWEQFGLGGEVNHAWTSYPGYLFQKYILGIQPTGGGFATFDIRPNISGLTFAEGAVPTVKGLITTGWKKHAAGKLSLSVHVPANTRATIYIPKLTQGDFTIMESGKILWPVASQVKYTGVMAVSEEETSIKCLVSAGDYRFSEALLNSK
ncbi:hypothetical protein GCM10023143_20120 [Compostibacter hankyongensis]|uniref:alpha-L-rhamnosidase n=2 Tax=Compostibacter hankyongensis TaxID=1007089 RepID=A0ABP8FUA0_9BACT